MRSKKSGRFQDVCAVFNIVISDLGTDVGNAFFGFADDIELFRLMICQDDQKNDRC